MDAADGFPADVTGWLTRREGDALSALAGGKTVLEIGSFRGRSTICLARTAARVFALDWHRGDADAGWAWTLPAMVDNLRRYGVEGRVVILVGRTEDVGPVLADGQFDLVFVDGAHDFAAAAADMRLARRVVKSGGVIALHDWNESGVRMAAADVLGWVPGPGPGGGTVDDLHYRAV